ncbi:T9SS type A sorting domain-containing protein [bacterium]|nr:T9SS type A sorting domain-containing protein [bacterium]
MRRLTGLFLILFVMVGVNFADDAVQTDWSGGGGVDGPVTDWGNRFDRPININWSDFPGELHLALAPIEHTIDSTYYGANFVYAADVDGDGDLDILGSGDAGTSWWENDGSGGGWTEHTIDDARSRYAADVDGDGDMDILCSTYDASDSIWLENDGSGGGWTEHLVNDSFGGSTSVYAADVDGDGDLDILGSSIDDGFIWWENDGSGGGWTEHLVDGIHDNAMSVYAADIDGDGDMDVLGALSYFDHYISWWENTDGFGITWTEHLVDGSFCNANGVSAADVDGDGDMDILGTAGGADDDISWWENDSSGGGWTEHRVGDYWGGANDVYATDIDGDGDTDILCAAYFANDISWWENDGSGGGWTEHTVDVNFGGAASVYAADVDGDGNMDILGAAASYNDITWWEAGFKTGNLNSSILDTDALPEWGQISWTADTPTDTTLSVKIRASNDSDNMGGWIQVVNSGDELGDYLTDYDRYFQYKVAFATTDSAVSPTFEDITINWTDCTAVESVDLSAEAADEGVLLSWSIIGDEPVSLSVLRRCGSEETLHPMGELNGSATSWLDVSAEAGVEYAYYLEVTEFDGTVSRFGPSEVVVPGMVSELALSDPYPNPADESLTIHYELTQNGSVELNVYDLSGRLVETLVSGEQTAGRHSVSWDSSTSATGVYLLRLEATGEAITKRAVISR